MLLESIVALGVLAVACTAGVQALAWAGAQRRLTDQRQCALQEAANLLEQVRQIPWKELTEDRLADIALSDETRQRLNSAQLNVTSEGAASELDAIKVSVEIQWLSRYSGSPWQVRLVTWRYPWQVEE
jgi:hypothetical protein